MVEDLETRVPHLDKACEEVSLRSSNKHADIVYSLIISYRKLPFEYTYWKGSMINRLSNLINRNRSAAKISQVLCSTDDTHFVPKYMMKVKLIKYLMPNILSGKNIHWESGDWGKHLTRIP